MNSPAPLTEKRYVAPFILVTSLFFLWAIGVNLNDILIPHMKKAFGLSDFRSSLIQSAFFGGYFIAALPAGWLIQRTGYKKGILFGLLVCATGAFLFIPAAFVRVYAFFLLALFELKNKPPAVITELAGRRQLSLGMPRIVFEGRILQ